MRNANKEHGRGIERSGFTLFELMVVVAIIGLLALLGGPELSRMIWKMRANQAAQGVVRVLNLARKTAMAENTRHCVTFGYDGAYANGGPDFMLRVGVATEDAPGIGTWSLVTNPAELVGFTNNQANPLYRGVSWEASANTDTPGGTGGCAGLVFNGKGYLDNPPTDFPSDCDGDPGSLGAPCIRMTMIQKALNNERRALWIDRGGNVRLSNDPSLEPVPAS